MPQDPADPWLNAFITAVAAASIMTWLFLLGRPRRWPFLAYEPRAPVPWGPAGAALALIFVATKVSELFAEHDGTPPTTPEMAMSIPLQLAIVAIFLAAVVALSGANPRDFGVDSFWRRFGRDSKTGIIACLAAFVPVFIIQVLLVSLQGAPTKHPLVTLVEEDPSWITLAVVCLAAVIVAPVCEEITFRLLLQGWLEKWEDQKLGRLMPSTPTELDMQVSGNGESPAPAAPDALAVVQPIEAWLPPQLGLGGMPHGWAPILLSSTAFALAHLGHGTDPIPLFPLAIILGYVYQRTHRILPCIVAHALFNSATMVVLWRTVASSGH